MKLNQQFSTFISNIRPTDRQKEGWRAGATTLRERLMEDETLSPIIVTTFLQGSIRRSTAIRPLGDKRPDVDVVVVTTIDYETVAPIDAMKLFIPFLDKYYPGKWAMQDRSFGIELSVVDMDLVITALPKTQVGRQLLEALYKSKAVTTTATVEEDDSWRLNKQWKPRDDGNGLLGQLLAEATLADDTDGTWRVNPLLLPDRTVQTWGRTHPLAQIQWTAAKNRRCGGHFINVVRSVKWWRQTKADAMPKYPKGYPLEHLIGDALLDGTEYLADGLVQTLESLRDKWANHVAQGRVPDLRDHGVPEHNVLKRLSFDDFKAFHAKVADAALLARRALANEDAQQSGKLWQELLGDRFPLPGPQGGDRGDGYPPPVAPANPKTSRFA